MARTFPSVLMKSPAQSRRGRWVALATILLWAFGMALPGVAAGSDIFVTTTQQGVSGLSSCSLQEAIYSSEFKTNKAIDATAPDHYYVTGCVPGTGNDTIVLPSDAVLTFNHFWDGDAYNIFGPTATPIIFSAITIEGNYSTLEWVGAGNSRLFAVAGPGIKTPGGSNSGLASLILRNVYVKGFHVRGGDGGFPGGGGGLGAGGAIYVNGVLTAVNSTFDSNGAVGGNGQGASDYSSFSGGGGGLSGNGGDSGVETSSGGGGGGSRGTGGKGADGDYSGGGGGGGTVFSGGDGTGGSSGGNGGPGGYLCGGSGGTAGRDGKPAKCAGGGGGGGGLTAVAECNFVNCNGNGGPGGFGGGGGGGAADGGNGGFGGGGGGGYFGLFTVSGGNGGFGGGGGGVDPNGATISSNPGKGGPFGGNANGWMGGGGGALGGAIFNDNGIVTIQNCTFSNNYVSRGVGGNAGASGAGDNGGSAGGAIFSYDNNLEIVDSTFSGNQSTGSGGAVVVYSNSSATGFDLSDTIIANNGANECYFTGNVNANGAGNLIMQNGTGRGQFSPCPGVVTSANPGLGKLQINLGAIPTMAIGESSPAWNTADAGTSLAKDQRGQDRPAMGGYDIGAFELCLEGRPPVQLPCPILGGNEVTEPLTMQVSPAASGSTNPPVGLTNEPLGSVPILTARGNLDYSFVSWTGNVTDPASASTTIIMDNAQTVTANFVPCTCAGDVTASVTITFGTIVLNNTTRLYDQSVTVTNTSGSAISGPISLVLDNLSSTATLSNATGTTDSQELPAGSPYLNSAANLAAGGSRAFALQFKDPSHANIVYTARVLAGPGAR